MDLMNENSFKAQEMNELEENGKFSTPTLELPSTSRRLTLVFSKGNNHNNNEENSYYTVKRKYPSLTPEKQVSKLADPNISPDLFETEPINYHNNNNNQEKIIMQEEKKDDDDEKLHEKLDEQLLKRISNGLNGLLPPPNVTMVHMSASDILNKLETNKRFWYWNNQAENSSLEVNKSLLLNVPLEEAKKLEFPQVLNARCHGLCYNCSKISEEIVDLCDKYQKRFVGAETQSTCTVFETNSFMLSPSKKRLIRPKWNGKSPGKRLSHLARRRITFSSNNLHIGGISLANSRARQILVESKKLDRFNNKKSPRKTPIKSPRIKTRTPSSSAKKKLQLRFRMMTGELEKSAQISPNKEKTQLRRALFTSPLKRKRKRDESGGEFEIQQSSKIFRSISMDVHKPIQSNLNLIARSFSEINTAPTNKTELNDLQKKKLLWAVSGALQSQNITNSHPQWKIFASVLARVIRRLFLTTITPSTTTSSSSSVSFTSSVSEKMNKLARIHVLSVIKGKSADEIINESLKNRKIVSSRPQGYVPPLSSSEAGNKVFQDCGNTIESWEKQRIMLEIPTKIHRIERIKKVINFGE